MMIPPIKRPPRTILPVFLLGAAILLAGCSSTRALTDDGEPNPSITAVAPVGLEASLRSEIDPWLGVSHVYGGTTRDGVDCSGFVYRIYSDLLGLELPRTTEQQRDSGRSVLRSSLRSGDLIFFKPDAKTRHVGIMLNDREFAHASSSRGVMISRIDESYWHDRYWLARRVLSESSLSSADMGARNRPKQTRMSW